MSPEFIAYEILRRDDGMIALSVSLGALPGRPLFMEPDLQSEGDVLLRPGNGEHMCGFAKLPADVIEYARSVGKIELYEFSRFVLVDQHELVWGATK